MYDDDKDALAAEYVLGTLSADEREHAEGLLLIDPGFEAAVRQWERRLGELNVMVEAVEPPAEVWERIKAGIFPSSALHAGEGREAQGKEAELLRLEEAAPQAPEQPQGSEAAEVSEAAEEAEAAEVSEAAEEAEAAEVSEAMEEAEEAKETKEAEEAEAPKVAEATEAPQAPEAAEAPSPFAALESSLFPPQGEPEPGTRTAAAADQTAAPSPQAEPGKVERSADVIYLARRLESWRRITFILGALAAVLALYVAVWQIAPGLVPPQLRPAGAGMVAHTQAPARLPQDRLVAVLQQEPTAPAFLLTLDTRNRMLIVRRVSATPEAGRSYELWLISKQFANPRSLGVVGDGEFTQRALPANYDVETLRAASYAVSLEPAGGSRSGVPTGPVLFTGKAVESLPGSPPPKT